MMTRKIALTVILALAGALTLCAQNVKDLVISEVQVDSVALDNGFGEKAAWIEIFNNSYGTVKMQGCYLTNDRNDLKKYFIPKTDIKASVSPRQSVVFFADGDSNKGTFHTNFTLSKGETVYLVSNDGRTVVDSLVIPQNLSSGKSIAKFANDIKAMVYDDIHETDPTPGTYHKNVIYDAEGHVFEETKAEKLARTDPHGFTMTLVAVAVVFSALIILFLCYTLVGAICTGKFKIKRTRKSCKKSKKGKAMPDAETAAAIAVALNMESSDEIQAAIGLALDRYFNECIHDNESYIITIRRK